MGGLGSGRRDGREPRRIVERAFALDIEQVLGTGLVAGAQAEITLWAPLIAWPVDVRFLIRRVDGYIATVWFDRPVTGGLVHLSIDVPARGSHRRRRFMCPGPDHAASAPVLVSKLYWPVGDPTGLACRTCHKLAYRSTRGPGETPVWLRRLRIAAGLSAEPEGADDPVSSRRDRFAAGGDTGGDRA